MRTQSTDAKRLQYKRDRPPTNADTPPEQHDQDSQRLPQVGNRQHHLCHLAQPADGRTSVKPIDDLCWAQSRVLDGRQPCGDPYARNNILAPALQPYYCAALLQCCNIQPTWAYAPAAWRGKRAEGTDCVAEALCRQNMLRMGLPLVMLRLQRGLENETFRFQTDLGRVVVDVRRRRALSPIAKLLIHSRKTIGSWEEPRDILDTTRTQTLPATMTTGRVSVSALDSLPDELILLILDQLDAGDYFTLRDLNATSSRFRRLTIDRLYRRFPGCSPEQFLRTIALSHPDERHEFMNYVKEVVWYQNYWDRLSRRRCLPLGDRHTVANILRSSGAILDTTDLSTDLPGRFIGFSSEYEVHWWYLEFFLFSTPKVEKITIHDAWQWDDHSYWFKSLSANPIHFENLRSITVFGPLRLRNIVPLLTLPSIHALDLTQVVDMRQEPDREFSWARDGEDYVDRRLASGSSLEHLVIRESDLHVPSAVGILGKLNKVKSFTYEHVCHELASHPGMQPSIFPWVGNLCWGPDSSLESLHLRIESSVVTHEEMTSLCHHVTGPVLARLRTLNIGPCSVSTFKGFDLAQSEDLPTIASRIVAAFPDTLEALQIQWAYERDGEPRLKFFIDILRHLAEAIAGSNSKLKHVSIVDWPALAGWFPFQDQVISLKRVYERRGLQFDIVYEEIEDGEPLTVMEDVEPGWFWIQRTEYFATHCRFSRPSSNHG